MEYKYVQVVTTADNKQALMKIMKIVVSKRLCACAQLVGPITSKYWWQGKLTTSKEWLCVIKTKKSLYKKLETEIIKNHPYTVPEILAIPIVDGNKNYLDWLEKETMK